jgi:hypothetical protein
VKRLFASAAIVAAAAVALVVAPQVQRPAEATTQVNCNPGLGSGPVVINTNGQRRTKARVCVNVSDDHQSDRAYVGYACEGLDGDGVWRAHNYCRWNPDPLQFFYGTDTTPEKSESTVVPATGFTSNATWTTTWYNPPGCGQDAIVQSVLTGTSKVRYDTGANPYTSQLVSLANRYTFEGC